MILKIQRSMGKMTGILMLLVCLSCLYAQNKDSVESQDKNVIKNKNLSFETGKGELPDGWIFYTNAPTNFRGIWEISEGHSGSRCVKIECSEKGGWGAWRLTPNPNFIPGKTYKISVWVKQKNLGGESTCLSVYSFDKNDKPTPIRYENCLPGTSRNWYNLTSSFKVPKDSAYCRISLLLTNKGEIWFDDIEIKDEGDMEISKNEKKMNEVEEDYWQANWIWKDTGEEAQQLYFRKLLNIEKLPKEAIIQIAVDNKYKLYINGQMLKEGANWTVTDVVNITNSLKIGKNIIAVDAENFGGEGGIIFEGCLNYKNNEKEIIVSDTSWKYSDKKDDDWLKEDFNDSHWKTPVLLGVPPKGVWGKINYYYIGPKTDVELVKVDAPNSIEAGNYLKVVLYLKPHGLIRTNKNLSIRLKRDKTLIFEDKITPSVPLSSWKEREVTKIGPISIPINPYLRSGEYSLEVDIPKSKYTNIENSCVLNFQVQSKKREFKESIAENKMLNGAPALFVNGRAENQFFESFLIRKAENYNRFAKIGINLTRVICDFRDAWLGYSQYSFEKFDNDVMTILNGNPDANLIVEIHVRGSHGQWWEKMHPEEICVLDNGQRTVHTVVSEKYIEDASQAILDLIKHINKSDYSEKVIGYFPMEQMEWLLPGTFGHFADYSNAYTNAFRKWVKEKYNGDVSLLRKKWSDIKVDFDTIEIPTREDRLKMDLLIFNNPSKSMKIIDFNHFISDSAANTIIHYCKLIKEATNNKAICGTYYGYFIELAKGYRIQYSGHLALKKVLMSPYVDFVDNIITYGHRKIGDVGAFESVVDSVKINKKICFVQDDQRTYLTAWEKDTSGYKLKNLKETLAALKRNFAQTFAHSLIYYNYDMVSDENTPNWYTADDNIMNCIGQMKKIADFGMDLDRTTASEIALIFDPESVCYMKPVEASSRGDYSLLGPLVYEFIRTIGRIGAPYDLYSFDDLDIMPQYKLYIFLNAFKIDENRLKIINNLKKNGKTLLWFYAPGFITENSFSVKNMEKTTGMRLGYEVKNAPLQIKILPSKDEMVSGIPSGSIFGTDNSIGPIFYCNDAKAVKLGELISNNKAGFSVKRFSNWTSVYLAAPLVGGDAVDILRKIAEEAGVFIYSRDSDAISVNKNFLSIHTNYAGRRKISLPEKKEVVFEVFDKKVIAKNTDSFEIEIPDKETKMFFMGSEETFLKLKEKIGN